MKLYIAVCTCIYTCIVPYVIYKSWLRGVFRVYTTQTEARGRLQCCKHPKAEDYILFNAHYTTRIHLHIRTHIAIKHFTDTFRGGEEERCIIHTIQPSSPAMHSLVRYEKWKCMAVCGCGRVMDGSHLRGSGLGMG